MTRLSCRGRGSMEKTNACTCARTHAHVLTHTHTHTHQNAYEHTCTHSTAVSAGRILTKTCLVCHWTPYMYTHTHTDTHRHSHRTNSSSAPSGPHLTRWGDGRPKLVSALHLKPFLMPAVPGWGNQRQVLKRGGLSLCRTLKYLTSCESQH